MWRRSNRFDDDRRIESDIRTTGSRQRRATAGQGMGARGDHDWGRSYHGAAAQGLAPCVFRIRSSYCVRRWRGTPWPILWLL